MDRLELQTSVQEVEPGRAVHVHGGAQHLLGKGFMHPEVGCRHGEMRQRDLHVQRPRHHVADHDEDEAVPRRRNAPVDGQVAKPVPEEELAEHFEMAVPPGGPFVRAGEEDEVAPGEAVEVEAAHGQDRVVEPILVLDGGFGNGVVGHDVFVVGALQAFEETVRDGEERHMFDIWIVLRGIGDNVVHIVVSFPPADAQAAKEVRDQDSDAGVYVERVRYTHVTGIMGGEDELVPGEAERKRGESVVAGAEEQDEEHEKKGVATEFGEIGCVWTVVEPFGANPVIEGTVFLNDQVLRC